MKTMITVLATIVASCLLPSNTNAQQVFGATHQSVQDTLLKSNYKFVKSAKANDNTVYDEYTTNEGDDYVCYFNQAGLCYEIRRFLNRSTLIDEVEYLNKKFIKANQYSWLNSQGTVKVYLTLPEGDNLFYSVSYYSMSVSDK